MGWLDDNLRRYAGDIDKVRDTLREITGGDGRANGWQSKRGTGRNGARSSQPPALDYLTDMEQRGWQGGLDRAGRVRFDREIPDHYWFASCHTPDLRFRGLRTLIADDKRCSAWTVPLGMCGPLHTSSEPQHHVLAIAPPRAIAGKTASLIIPAVLTHPNPVVTASTKADVLSATAMARAQYGRLWCYSPCGTADIPPGVEELRWSPIAGAKDWDVAVATATAMAKTIDTTTVRGGDHWKDRAADLLAAVFHWAALTKAMMRDARNVILDHDAELPRVAEQLASAGAPDAARMLASVCGASGDEARGIASSAARVLKGYRTDAALRSTEGATFDIADFVNGGPCGVRADTVYITARTDEQELAAPLVVGLLDEIQRAVYARHRRLESAGLIGKAGAAPILFALDELYGLAPLPNLPHMLTEGGSQGLLIVAAVQDLSLIKSRWPQEAGAFMTMFGHVLVYPGIRDVETLKAISTLTGMRDKHKREKTVKQGIPAGADGSLFSRYEGPTIDQEENARLTSERRPVLDPHQVMLGVDPRNPLKLLHFGPPGAGTVTATPYFRSAPWPMLLTAYLERAVSGCMPEWRHWEESRFTGRQPEGEDTLTQLPVPRLDEWVKKSREDPRAHPCDRAWAARYTAALRHREAVLHEAVLRGEPRTYRREPSRELRPHQMWFVTDDAGRVPSPNDPRVYISPAPQQYPIEVSDEHIRLLASGAWTPTKEVLDDIWGTHRIDPGDGRAQRVAQLEARMWQRAQAAAATAERERTADDKEIIAWAVLGAPGVEVGTGWWVKALIGAEISRRSAAGEEDSVTRYVDAVARAQNARRVEGSDEWREDKMRSAVLERRPPSPVLEWAQFIVPAVRELMVAFVLRRDLEADGEPQPDEDGRLTRLAGQLEAMQSEAARLSVPDPVARFDWDATWGREDDEAMGARGDDDPLPEKWHEMEAVLFEAISKETEHRQQHGDSESVERYEEARASLMHDLETTPSLYARGNWERTAARVAGQDWGWWKWVAADLLRLDQAFLLGKDLDTGHEEPDGEAAEDADPVDDAGTESTDDDSEPHETDAPNPLPKVTPEPVPEPQRWEPAWGPEEDAAMQEWARSSRSDTDTPECFTRTFETEMEAAIQREKDRRHEIGDARSILIFEENRARFRRRLKRASLRELVLRDVTGFWPLVQPDLATLVRAFLHGDDLAGLYGRGPTPAVGNVEDEGGEG